MGCELYIEHSKGTLRCGASQASRFILAFMNTRLIPRESEDSCYCSCVGWMLIPNALIKELDKTLGYNLGECTDQQQKWWKEYNRRPDTEEEDLWLFSYMRKFISDVAETSYDVKVI
jgi:hypothetical protein